MKPAILKRIAIILGLISIPVTATVLIPPNVQLVGQQYQYVTSGGTYIPRVAVGSGNSISADHSLVIGSGNQVTHGSSLVVGQSLRSVAANSLTVGKFNTEAPGGVLVVGNGEGGGSAFPFRNAFEVYSSGVVKIPMRQGDLLMYTDTASPHFQTNNPPVVQLASVIVGQVNVPLQVTATVSDETAPNQLTCGWSVVSKPASATASFNNPNFMSPKVTMNQPGEYMISLQVGDGVNTTTAQSAVVIMEVTSNPGPTNNLPVIGDFAFGLDGAATLPQTATLTGITVQDETLASLAYLWSLPLGSTGVTFANANVKDPTVTVTANGTYVLQLQVTDGLNPVAKQGNLTVNFAGQPPPVAQEFAPDANTAALYHFNGNPNDATTNALHLTPAGSVTYPANPTWMSPPAGAAVRFANRADQLTGSVSDNLLQPGAALTFTLEARFFVRNYKGYSIGACKILSLDQAYDSSVEIVQDTWASAPEVRVSGTRIIAPSAFDAAVTRNAWNKLKITVHQGQLNFYVNDALVNATPATISLNAGRTSAWALTLGNLDGDLDEVRISNIVR